MTGTLTSRRFLAVLALGLALRAPGLLFNGTSDLMEAVLDWGADVVALGLARGFSVNYGVLSFAFFGACAAIAESIPRFWWLPEKAFIIAFEAGVFWALLRFVPGRAGLITMAYWLNPWFIWHGAYQGFWDSPHLFFALCGVLVLARRQDRTAWMTAGLLLFCSGQFKPQGIIHFAAPLGLFLAVDALRGRWKPFVWYASGFGAAAAVTALLLCAGGASPLALVHNFQSSLVNRPWLSNGGPGLWRFVSFAAMQWQGLEGDVTLWRVSIPALLAISALTSLGLLGVFLAFFRRLSQRGPVTAASVYLVFVFGALVVSQFGLRSHVNHSYPAILLLVPLLAGERRLRWAWAVMMGITALALVRRYGMGVEVFLPRDVVLDQYGNAGALATAIKAVPAFSTPDGLIEIQAAVNGRLLGLVSHETISMLSLVVFAAACVLVAGLFRIAGSKDPAS
jgi:hypothetical protein